MKIQNPKDVGSKLNVENVYKGKAFVMYSWICCPIYL
jgi:hypothetical protein